MRKAALAGVRARAEIIRSPSFSRDSESRTTMASPRARKAWLAGGLSDLKETWERRTECFNGFWDGVEGGLGGAVWLLVGGRHCGWMSGGVLPCSISAYAPVVSSMYVSTGQWSGIVSARRVSLSRKVPNADVAGCSMRSDSSSS